MVRPQKDGLDYFSHDVDARNDKKIKALRAKYGAEGYLFYFVMLEHIYSEDQAALDVSDAETMAEMWQILARDMEVTPERFTEMLETALKWGCFDREIFEKQGLITSNGIRKRAGVAQEKRLRMREYYQSRVSAAETQQKPSRNAAEKHSFCPSSALPRKEKERKEKGPPLPPKGSDCETFADFWDAYPRKTEKQSALKAYITLIKRKESPDDLLTAATNYAALCRDERREAKHIKHAATFLREDRWRDYLTPQATSETGERDDGVRVPNYKTVDELVAEGVIPG